MENYLSQDKTTWTDYHSAGLFSEEDALALADMLSARAVRDASGMWLVMQNTQK